MIARAGLACIIAGVVLLSSAGCGSSSKDATLDEACARMAECRADVTVADCVEVFDAAVTPTDCFNQMRDAPCEDHQQPTAYRETCFPTCFAPSQQCVNDTLLACIDWGGGEYRQALLSCEGICADDGLNYTGTCGLDSPGGEHSDEDVCWCTSE